MGGVWKFKMPLLSTLAALVIIVHTAEENYERENRVIRSRALDVGPASYDQSWRVMETEPTTIQPPQRNQERWDEVSPDQPLRRRRRKRKRRPNQDEISPEESFLNQEASQTQDALEMPRRRRKKVDRDDSRERSRKGNWGEEGQERPRRRGHRRKRPQVDSWPQIDEYNDFRQNRPDKSEEIVDKIRFENNLDDKQKYNDEQAQFEPSAEFYDQNRPQYAEMTTRATKDIGHESLILKDDISFSELSSESKRSEKTISVGKEEKINEKVLPINGVELTKDKEPLDPQTLKTILKKSNGKSLSEILQQHNLSLTDLLHGKEKALAILKRKEFEDSKETGGIEKGTVYDNRNARIQDKVDKMIEIVDHDYRPVTENNKDEKEDSDTTTDCSTSTETVTMNIKVSSRENSQSLETTQAIVENTTNRNLRRRFPVGMRRRLRIKPHSNETYKAQLSRDLINLSSMKYKNSRTKSKEWKDILPTMMRRGQAREKIVKVESSSVTILTTMSALEETTTELVLETTTDPSDSTANTDAPFYLDSEKSESLNAADSKRPFYNTEQLTTVASNEDSTKEIEVEIEKPKISPIIRPLVNSSELRRQAYNNRLKRKRLKQKTSTTEQPDNQGLKDIYGTSNYVSASEFIAKTRTTQTEQEDYSTLEDFMTTEASRSTENDVTKSTKANKHSTFTTQVPPVTTGETAKYEIEELLNDDLASARLSKILKERNMTLMELVEHRERGSSHVHLADIFHNASKEPNPPEPFLSKSLIEPISKETYPLRALLEASSHEAKTTTIDPNSSQNNLNIPVVMDFGNNVNENGENMGIISLFHNFSRIDDEQNKSNELKIIEDRSDEIADIKNHTAREGRVLRTEKDLLSWNDLINLMQKTRQSEVADDEKLSTNGPSTFETPNKTSLEQDNDSDGLIVLEDLQRLKDFDSRITSDELLEIKVYENNENKPIVNSVVSNTKSVTVATASIIGLALILFLLTYAILKWRQQNKIYHNNKEVEHVPSPIFENRKGLKINSSTRSKSPMLSSNIYTVETIDTHVGNESPEYMWDSLRKPFQ